MKKARALVDLPQFGCLAGAVVSADSGDIDALEKIGAVDSHPDAVAYAASEGVEPVSVDEEQDDQPEKPKRGRKPKAQ